MTDGMFHIFMIYFTIILSGKEPIDSAREKEDLPNREKLALRVIFKTDKSDLLSSVITS